MQFSRQRSSSDLLRDENEGWKGSMDEKIAFRITLNTIKSWPFIKIFPLLGAEQFVAHPSIVICANRRTHPVEYKLKTKKINNNNNNNNPTSRNPCTEIIFESHREEGRGVGGLHMFTLNININKYVEMTPRTLGYLERVLLAKIHQYGGMSTCRGAFRKTVLLPLSSNER